MDMSDNFILFSVITIDNIQNSVTKITKKEKHEFNNKINLQYLYLKLELLCVFWEIPSVHQASSQEDWWETQRAMKHT